MGKRVTTALGGLLLATTAAVVLTPGLSAASDRLVPATDGRGNQLMVSVNSATGSAHRVYGELAHVSLYGFRSGDLDRDSILQLSRSVFADYGKILKVAPDDLAPRIIDSDGEMWFVTYQQTYRGLPVERTEAGYTLDADGRMVALGADVYPIIDIETTPQVSAEEALGRAKNLFGDADAETRVPPALIVYPRATKKGTTFLLAWKMELASNEAPRDVVYFIDAVTGVLIESYNNIRDFEIHGTFSGQYYPQHNYDPLASANYSTTTIKIFDVFGRLITQGNSDGNGFYSLPFGGGFGNYFLQAPLENSFVQLQDAANNNSLFYHSFQFTSSSGTLHNYQWAAGDASNVRYHAGFVHDYYKNTFSYAGMDYRAIARVNAGAGTNGSSDGTNIFFGSYGGQLWARSSDVVYHEYTHSTIYHIYGGWIGNGANAQGPAMDEGLSDYFACTLNNDPIQGEDVGVNRNLDNNTYTWNPSQGPHWNGQVVGGASWDVRQAVGTAIADNLVFRALQVSPKARSFSEFADNMVVADNSYYAGSHRTQIAQSFANHGICVTTAAPSPVAPTSGTPGLSVSPTLDWSDAVGATGYDVQVATDSGFASIVRSASVPSSSWVVSPALANATTYFWRVRATSSCPASAWTTGWSFTTAEVDYVDCGTSCVNLAPGKTVTASGLWDPPNSPGTKLVDLNTGTNPTCEGPNGYCAIACDPGHAQAVGNYFQIDLGAVKSVKSVRVYGRRDFAVTQGKNLKLRLSRDGVSWTDFTMADTTMQEGLLVPTARQARYVKIETTTISYLSLYEAVVNGPCEVLCNCGNGNCDQDEWCDTCPQDCHESVINLPGNMCAMCDASGEVRCGPGMSLWCCPF
jgi:Zn-dependent metalloprotease